MRTSTHVTFALVVSMLVAASCGDDSSTSGDGGGSDAGDRDAGGPRDGGTDGGALDGGPTCVSSAAHAIGTAAGVTSNAGDVSLVATDVGYGVAWHDPRGGDSQIYFARLDATGARIGDEVRVTSDEGVSASPDLVWSGTEFALAWMDDRDGNTEIYFTRLSSDGVEIGDDVRVTTDAARSEFPSLVWTGDGFGVAWNDTRPGTFQIYFARLGPTGTKMADDVRVSSGSALAASASLAWDGSGYGTAWHDTRDMMGLQIYFARLGPAGALVGMEERLSPAGGGNASVAWSGAAFGITWPTNPGMGGEVYLARVEGGEPTAPVPVTDTTGTARAASLVATDGGGFAVAWMDRREADAEVHLGILDATGAPVGSITRVTDDATDSVGPSLVAAHGGYAIAWIDAPTDMTGTPYFASVCP